MDNHEGLYSLVLQHSPVKVYLTQIFSFRVSLCQLILLSYQDALQHF